MFARASVPLAAGQCLDLETGHYGCGDPADIQFQYGQVYAYGQGAISYVGPESKGDFDGTDLAQLLTLTYNSAQDNGQTDSIPSDGGVVFGVKTADGDYVKVYVQGINGQGDLLMTIDARRP